MITKVMRLDIKLQLNSHKEAVKNAKKTSKCSRDGSTQSGQSFIFGCSWGFSSSVFGGLLTASYWWRSNRSRRICKGSNMSRSICKWSNRGGVGDSIPQADSSLSFFWRDPSRFSDGGTHPKTRLNSNCHREMSKSSPSITLRLDVSAESVKYFSLVKRQFMSDTLSNQILNDLGINWNNCMIYSHSITNVWFQLMHFDD